MNKLVNLNKDNINKNHEINYHTLSYFIIGGIILSILIFKYELVKNRNLNDMKISDVLYIIAGVLAFFRILPEFEISKKNNKTYSAGVFFLVIVLVNIKNIIHLLGY